VKRPGAGLRFFGSSLPRPDSSPLIYCDEPSPIPTFAGSFIPITADRLFSFSKTVPMSDQKAKSGLLLRRRNKVVGFIIAEAVAIGLLVVAGAIAVALKPSDPALAWSINIATIAAAVAVAIIPIIYFAIAPVLPHEDRR